MHARQQLWRWKLGSFAALIAGGSLGVPEAEGPGAGPWMTLSPELVGLKREDLQRAATALAADMPPRNCWAVFRGGALIHEEYYGSATAATEYETDSAMKTGTALVMGVAWTRGLFDLDRPIASYGVQPLPTWTADPKSLPFYPKVTARMLLSQVAGSGQWEPASKFVYSSGNGIQHLERLLAVLIGSEHTTRWANQNLGAPLGLPHLFSRDGPQFSAGGGQLMTCRDMARIGQLILNKGRWRDRDGSSFQLVSEEYIAMMTTPSYPHVASTYGFLTWLGDPVPTANAAYPRWGPSHQCIQVDGGTTERYDFDRPVYMSCGWMAKLMLVLPHEDLVLITFGNTLVGSAQCDIRYDEFKSNDDSYSVFLAWNRLRHALPKDLPPVNISRVADHAEITDLEAMAHGQKHGREIGMLDTIKERRGSCTCTCIPDQGYGTCFDVPPAVSSDADCEKFSTVAGMQCPLLGLVQECRVLDMKSLETVVQNSGAIASADDMVNPCYLPGLKYNASCSLVRACTLNDAEPADGKRTPVTGACVCQTTHAICTYDPDPCVPDDAYTPTLHLNAAALDSGDLDARASTPLAAYQFLSGGFAVAAFLVVGGCSLRTFWHHFCARSKGFSQSQQRLLND